MVLHRFYYRINYQINLTPPSIAMYTTFGAIRTERFLFCISIFSVIAIVSATTCTNSFHAFEIITAEGGIKNRSCEWARRKKTRVRCKKHQIVKEMCPHTCSNCCVDQTIAFNLKKNGKEKTCEWAKKKPELIAKRCKKQPVALYCADTCESCVTPNPTAGPTTAPARDYPV